MIVPNNEREREVQEEEETIHLMLQGLQDCSILLFHFILAENKFHFYFELEHLKIIIIVFFLLSIPRLNEEKDKVLFFFVVEY